MQSPASYIKAKKLLHILSDGQTHSGVELGENLGISRGGVWKLIRQLKEQMGIAILGKTNQGYRIEQSLELLSIARIKHYLPEHYHPYLDKSIIFDEIPSTNSYLLEQLHNKNEDIYFCMAEMQTAGRSKSNKRWVSPFGRNVYLSLMWHFSGDLPQLSGLSLAIAVALVRVLKKLGLGEGLEIKWPNDVLWHKRKLSGILIDLMGEFNSQCHAVIGMGVNVALDTALKNSLDFPVTDLAEMMTTPPGRNQLHALLIEELLVSLPLFQQQGLAPFMAEYQAVNFLLGKNVQIHSGNNIFYGISRGIDDHGYFLLENDAGAIQRFSCGETSLRPAN